MDAGSRGGEGAAAPPKIRHNKNHSFIKVLTYNDFLLFLLGFICVMH